jgi:hypothetical protein
VHRPPDLLRHLEESIKDEDEGRGLHALSLGLIMKPELHDVHEPVDESHVRQDASTATQTPLLALR